MTDVVGPFRKSSYSGQQGNCVEVAPTAPQGRTVRDSKDPEGPWVTVSRDGWEAFVRQFGWEFEGFGRGAG